jgi:hypothetical protein
MIKYGLDEHQITPQKTAWRGYDGASALRWNFKIKPFIQ